MGDAPCDTRDAMFAALLLAILFQDNAAPPERASLVGIVADSRSGEPLAKALVEITDLNRTAITDDAGRFALVDLPPGRHVLTVSLVGYGFARRDFLVASNQVQELRIPLAEGTGTYTEEVTVTADRREAAALPARGRQFLGSADLQSLRGVLADDPMRAVQSLPGVATSDDLRSEFSVRGSDFRHIGLTLDQVPIPWVLHTVRGIQDGGSVAMINSDTLEEVELLNGAYPQRFGNRIGAEVNFRLREGSRERFQARGAVSGTNTSIVLEGPLGVGRKGSWLFSARKSYLDLVINQLFEEDDFTFGFVDVQVKLAYDASSRQRVELAALGGRSRLKERPEEVGINSVFRGTNETGLVTAAWRLAPSPSTLLTVRAYLASTHFWNTNREHGELANAVQRDGSARVTFSASPAAALAVETGAQTRVLRDDERRRRYSSSSRRQMSFDASNADASLHGAYGLVRWQPSKTFSISPGVRIDRFTLTHGRTTSPWMQVDWTLARGMHARAGVGVYHQFPAFDQVWGSRSGPTLAPERAIQADVSVDGPAGSRGLWQVTLFSRRERDRLRARDAEMRLVSGVPRQPARTPTYDNTLTGYSRGLELVLERRSPNGVSGWLAYTLAFTRESDRRTSERFWADFDQRHTFNAYAHYRFSSRLSASVKFRAGSNFPITGYVSARGDEFFIGEERNAARLPAYARLDLRANRTFEVRTKRLTLFAEVINVLNRRNARTRLGPTIESGTGRVVDPFEKLIPVVPSAGLLLEW